MKKSDLLENFKKKLTHLSNTDSTTSFELILKAIDQAYKIIFVVDGKVGLQGLDLTVAQHLRRVTDKILLAVNKMDEPNDKEENKITGKGKALV